MVTSLCSFFAVAFASKDRHVPGTKVCISDGCLQGLARLTDDVYYNIPYAAVPLGDLRFKSPVPPIPWHGVRDATKKGFRCIQNGNAQEIGNSTSEDCLQLNVYVPAHIANDTISPLPVAAWIHGGGYQDGSAVDFDPIALMGGIDNNINGNAGRFLVVTINYRLNIFGFLGSESLRSAGGTTGNAGIEDQRQALRWIRKNIGAFGGDPSKVTIFGESAGAGSVTNHLVQPQSAGLFRAALLESGSFAPWAAHPMWHAEMVFQKVLQLTGCPSGDEAVACLKKMDAGRLVSAVKGITLDDTKTPIGEDIPSALVIVPYTCPWSPAIDGISLKDHPLVLVREGKTNPGAVMHGTNRDEAQMFTNSFGFAASEDDLKRYLDQVYGNKAAALKAFYRNQSYPDTPGVSLPYWEGMRQATDYFFGCTTREASIQLTRAGREVYEYQFNKWSDGFNMIPHAFELRYVWGYMLKPSDYKIAVEVQTLWGTFFHDGSFDRGVFPMFRDADGGVSLSISETTSATFPTIHRLKADVCDSFLTSFIVHKLAEIPPHAI